MSNDIVAVKSKFDAEYRRFALDRSPEVEFEEFHNLLENLHKLFDIPFLIFYIDPSDQDLLPINNDDNLRRALTTAKPLLRIVILREGEDQNELTHKSKNFISTILGAPTQARTLAISNPQNFRQVSAIIDVDLVPETCRRVRLLKHGSDKPLGFYIRDGTSLRVTCNGIEKTQGIFISRLVEGGLAESTGLLGVNDEILEVNGIEVYGKSLDQVTDMMIANSSNLIITVKPANQTMRAPAPPAPVQILRRDSFNRHSDMSKNSEIMSDPEDQDEIIDNICNEKQGSEQILHL